MCLFFGQPAFIWSCQGATALSKGKAFDLCKARVNHWGPMSFNCWGVRGISKPQNSPLACSPTTCHLAIWMMKLHLIKNHGKNLGCDAYQLSNTYNMFGHLIKDLFSEKSCAVRNGLGMLKFSPVSYHPQHRCFDGVTITVKFITCVCPNRVPS